MSPSIEWSEPPSFRKEPKRNDVAFYCRGCRRPNFKHDATKCVYCCKPRNDKPSKKLK